MVERLHSHRDLSRLEARVAGTVFIARVYDVVYDPPRARVLYGEDPHWPPMHVDTFDLDKQVSNWLPWITMRAQNDSSWAPIEEGEQVLVLAQSGDRTEGIILGGLYRDEVPPPAKGDDERNWWVWWHRIVPKTRHWIAKAERILKNGNVCGYRKAREGTPTAAPTYERREVIRPETEAVMEHVAQATCNGGTAATRVTAGALGAGTVADMLLEAGVVGPGATVSTTLQAVNGAVFDPQPMPPTDRAGEIGSTRGPASGPATLVTRAECLGPGDATRTHTNRAASGNATEAHTIQAGGGHADHTTLVKGASAHFRLEVTDGGNASYIDMTPTHIVISAQRIDLNPDR